MRPMRTRWLAFVALFVVMYGGLAAVGGYALYLRSELHRRQCAAELAEAVGLPAEIGAIIPRARALTEFRDIVVWLPRQQGEAFQCEQAFYRTTASAAAADGWELEVRGGSCEISDRTWLRHDARRVLERGLRPGFADGPQRVGFENMQVQFRRDGLQVEVADASGELRFAAETGTARASAWSFNGHALDDPVLLTAAFSSQPDGIQADDIQIRVPWLPIALLNLGEALPVAPTSGRFRGELGYREGPGGAIVRVAGECVNLDLSEWTGELASTPWPGRCPELTLDRFVLLDRRPVSLAFAGLLDDLRLGAVLAPLGYGKIGGDLTLQVGAARVDAGGIGVFRATGKCLDLDLAELSRVLGRGAMTGRLQLLIHDVQIEDNRLRAAEIVVQTVDAPAEPNWIEGRLVSTLAEELLGRPLPTLVTRMLPKRIEYTRFGARLSIRDEQMIVLGTHGDQQATVLTVVLPGIGEMPLVQQPRDAINLSPLLEPLREQLQRHLADTWASAPSPG